MKIDRSIIIFLLIGCLNTALNWALMLVLYTHAGLSYWLSSAIGYVVTSTLSFVLNRRYSFASKGSVLGDLWRFALVIAACYLVANGFAKPFVEWVVARPLFSSVERWSGQIALIFGNVIFTGLNYVGQRFFAFARRRH